MKMKFYRDDQKCGNSGDSSFETISIMSQSKNDKKQATLS